MKKQHAITWQMGNHNFAMVTKAGDTPEEKHIFLSIARDDATHQD